MRIVRGFGIFGFCMAMFFISYMITFLVITITGIIALILLGITAAISLGLIIAGSYPDDELKIIDRGIGP